METYIPPFPLVPRPNPLLGEEKMSGGGYRAGPRNSQETLTWTEFSARPTSFSAQHVTFFLLRLLVTLAKVSSKDGKSPDFCIREKTKIRKGFSRLGTRGKGLGLMPFSFSSRGKGYQDWGEGIGEKGGRRQFVCSFLDHISHDWINLMCSKWAQDTRDQNYSYPSKR